jgi:hypothetical protein
MAHRFTILSTILVLILLFLSTTVQSQSLSSFSLKGVVTSNQVVNLSWTAPKDSGSHIYKVWRGVILGSATFDTTIAMTQIASVTDTYFVDTPKVIAPTSFMYVVKTTNAKLQTIRSSYATVEVIPKIDNIRITSDPNQRGRVGVLYSYQVNASSDDKSAVLKYKLLLKPAAMTIDTSVGLISWTPNARGFYNVSVIVSSSGGGKAIQNYSIAISAGNGTVTGVVRDSVSGNGINKVFLKLYEKDANFHLGFQATTDSAGNYTIRNVDPGVYYLEAYPFNPHYLPQWYNRARFRIGATSITVADSPAVFMANFSLITDTIHLPIYRAKGKVTDTLGNAIKGALIVWARGEFIFNGSKFFADDSMHNEGVREALDPNNSLPDLDMGLDNPKSRWTFSTNTDSTGNYSIRVPKGYYIIRAWKQGYHKLFYNNKSNIIEADIFSLKTDTTNINFALRPIPTVFTGEISGSVIDTAAKRGVFARVIAYREWWSVHDTIPLYRHYSVDSDTLGHFDITNLPPGQYRILALPLGQYVPSFYNSSGALTIRWRLATVVSINDNDVSGIDIFVRPVIRSSVGYTSINGSAMSSTPTNPTGLAKTTTGYPISGGLVYAIDTAGIVAGYAITDATGSYTITGLAPSVYSMTMDCHDYMSMTASNVSPSYNIMGADVSATQNFLVISDVTSVANEQNISLPLAFSLSQNYPNPFNPTTQIQFSLQQSDKISLTIYNLLGQKVATIAEGVYQAGSHIATWNGRNGQGIAVSSGVYFYRLSGSTFEITKKMLMLK